MGVYVCQGVQSMWAMLYSYNIRLLHMALNYAFFVSGKLFSVISKGLSLGANDHLNLPLHRCYIKPQPSHILLFKEKKLGRKGNAAVAEV